MVDMETVMAKLQSPFPPEDLEWRVQQCGNSNGKIWCMPVVYVTNRAIQARLDEIFGPFGWWNEYRQLDGGFICGITCQLGDKTVTKWDGAPQTQIESFKGGLSDAMKRAGYQWGIGRYLYKLDVAFAKVVERGTPGAIYFSDKTKKVSGYFLPPPLPDWALPPESKGKPQVAAGSVVTPQQPTESPLDQITNAFIRVMGHPQPTGGQTTYQYLTSMKDRVHKKVDDGTITQEQFDKLITEHFIPAVKAHCPDMADTVSQLEEIA